MTTTTNTKHGVFARTVHGYFRVGGWSKTFDAAERRWAAATNGGRHVDCQGHAFLDGCWQPFTGDLVVRSALDPAVADARLANSRTATGTTNATVRAHDFRKVR